MAAFALSSVSTLASCGTSEVVKDGSNYVPDGGPWRCDPPQRLRQTPIISAPKLLYIYIFLAESPPPVWQSKYHVMRWKSVVNILENYNIYVRNELITFPNVSELIVLEKVTSGDKTDHDIIIKMRLAAA